MSYTDEDLQKALDAVNSGRTLGSVSKEFNIPKSTLFDKANGLSKPVIGRPGPVSVLGEFHEHKLVEWILFMFDQGFPVTKDQLLNSVQKLVESMDKVAVFTDGRPGRHWYEAFQKRHPEIEDRIADNTSCQAKLTNGKLRQWFDHVRNHLSSKNLLDIDSSRVFNCEESGFYLSPKGQKVMIKRANRSAFDDKDCLTTLFCGNAGGKCLPPMITFNYLRIPAIITALAPKDYIIGRSTTGWMTPTSFLDWICKTFQPWIVNNKIELPVVLYLNGHSSYLTLQLSDFCRNNGIELISIHPSCISFLQPMDVAVFHPLKGAWRDAVAEWRLTNHGDRVKREHFGGVLEKALENIKWERILADGFRTTGLHPFNSEAIQYEESVKIPSPPLAQRPSAPVKLEFICPNEDQMTYSEFVEANIDDQVLEAFKLVGEMDEWSGDITQKGLFLFWRRVKNYEGSHETFETSASAENDQNLDLQRSCLAATNLQFNCPSFNTFLNDNS